MSSQDYHSADLMFILHHQSNNYLYIIYNTTSDRENLVAVVKGDNPLVVRATNHITSSTYRRDIKQNRCTKVLQSKQNTLQKIMLTDQEVRSRGRGAKGGNRN